MLTIRREQMFALEAWQRDNFCAELSQALQMRFPHLQRICSNDDLTRAVNQCLYDAQSMGFDARSEIAYYALLCFQFGIGFIDDPLLPWVAEAAQHAPVERFHYLDQGAKDYGKEVFGTDQCFLKAALERWITPHFVTQPLATDSLAILYPEKAEHAGPLALTAFRDATEEIIRTLDIVDPSLGDELTRCAFIFGHRLHEDPFVPQIRGLLDHPSQESPAQWIARLQALALDLFQARSINLTMRSQQWESTL